jgi:protein-S-isoprenylcysteine O-methyltransferase Ste14
VLNRVRIARLPGGATSWAALGVAVAGLTIRLHANRTLGRFYTRTLRMAADQPIVERGLYRVVRHPGYLGVLLMWIGAALATANGITAAITAGTMTVAYGHRIRAEERMLSAASDDYRRYVRRTWRLIPLLY